jgi:hypothetical protein
MLTFPAFSTFGKHGKETMFPGLPILGKHGWETMFPGLPSQACYFLEV